MEDLKTVIARNIQELRLAKKMTQLELAELLNYSDKAVSKWERAESIPDVAVLKQIADVFSVSVDYLLNADHTADEKKNGNPHQSLRRTHFIISLLAATLVWLIATFTYVVLGLLSTPVAFPAWLVFIYGVPVCTIVILILNSVWGVGWWNYVIISVLVWGTITSVYLSVLLLAPIPGFWLIYLIGIPAELIIFLWSRLKNTFALNIFSHKKHK